MKRYNFVPVLALFLLPCLFFGGCTRAERVDYSGLNRRLKQIAPEYEFNEDEIFFNDSVYYAFYSVLSRDDMLLTMTEDEDLRLIAVSLTASGNDTSEEFRNAFLSLAAAVADAFAPPVEAEELKRSVNGYRDILFTERFDKTESGRYTVELFSDPIGVSVILSRA